MHANIPSQIVDKRREGFGQWMNSSIMHDNIVHLFIKSVISKVTITTKKYHDRTLNIIFNVITYELDEFEK
jgi:hypothetical protein